VINKTDKTVKKTERYLRASFFMDWDQPLLKSFVKAHSGNSSSPVEQAVRLYYAVRDGFRYNPYGLHYKPEEYKASAFLSRSQKEGGHCIDKANLLAACCRSLGIPSRLCFVNVRNHIGTEKLEQEIGTDIMVFHGYVQLWLEGKWVAATPAFNKELCDHLGVYPLEFDGKSDSLFQEFDRKGGKFMEYVHDYGHFDDIPFDLMVSEWKKYYPDYIRRKFGHLISGN
jgi:transglutaminase-like putative cysteine protease